MSIKNIFEQTIQRGGFDLAEMLERIDLYNVEAKITDEELEYLSALARELQQAQGEGGGAEPTDEWPEYVQPTGAHDAYQVGDKITFNGVHYICRMNARVWSPDVYPAGWEAQAA